MLDNGLWAIRADMAAQSSIQAMQIRENREQSLSDRRGEPLSKTVFTFARRIGAVAIIPVIGPLFSRMNFFVWSYDEILRDINLALDDDTIEKIVLDVDSPGGMVGGCDDCAAAIRGAAAIKPIVAHSGGLMASAAYWLASAAPEICCSGSATIGSIGAIIRYLDIEGIFLAAGGRIIEAIAAQSPNKRLDPESEEGAAEMQALVDESAALFINDVAMNRGETAGYVMENYGGGLVFKASEASRRGMIDRIEGFDQYLAAVAARKIGPLAVAVAAAAQTIEDKTMDYRNLTAENLREHRADLVAEIESEARAVAEAERDEAIAERRECEDRQASEIDSAVMAERARVVAIRNAGLGVGQDDLVDRLISDGASVADATTKLLTAIKKDVNSPLRSLESVEGLAGGIRPAYAPNSAGGEKTPEAWEAEWQSSKGLQAEFPTAGDYVAFKKAESSGKVRIYQGGKAA